MAEEAAKPGRKRNRKPGGGRANRSTRKAAGSGSGGKRGGAPTGTTPWEWAVAGVGGVILAAIVGFLVYEALAQPPQTRPEIVASGGDAIRLASGVFLVPVTVRNEGHATGAGVTVTGALLGEDGAALEESDVTFDFVAQHSTETGGLYFSADPGMHRLVIRVEGYTDP